MSLTRTERQMLANQHQILSLLSTEKYDKEYHSMMYEVYYHGFEHEFFEHGVYDEDETLDNDSCKLVYSIINMYDDLYYYWKINEEAKQEIKEYRVMFPGFDLNHPYESKMYSFAKFLIEDLNRFHDTNDMLKEGKIPELNSHGSGPGVRGYRLMLEKFEKINDTRFSRDNKDLTVEEIKDIINYN